MRQFINRPLADGFAIAGIVGNYFIGCLCNNRKGKKKKIRQQDSFHSWKLENFLSNTFK